MKEDIIRSRKEKLERLKLKGIPPYPLSYHRTHTNEQVVNMILEGKEDLPQVRVSGRVMAHRNMGKVSFIDLVDGSQKIQLYVKKEHLSEESGEVIECLDLGDIIGAEGRPFLTRTKEPSIDTSEIIMLAKSLQPLPEKWHGLADTEKRYRQRYLDIISNPEVKDIFKKRSQIVSSVRRHLDERGFLEVETQILQPIAGGASARPFITYYNALDQNFYLRIALELHLKRLIVAGYDRVYELGRVFRNEGIDTRHNPEFTMLECYQAYADYHDMMQLVEEMVSDIVREINHSYQIEFAGRLIDFEPPWKRLDLRQALIDYAGIDFLAYPDANSLKQEMMTRGFEVDPQKSRGKLLDELLSRFVEPELWQPTFLLDYPKDMSPLAKAKPDDPQIVERFESFAGCLEIANAFTELNDPLEQRERFLEQLKEVTAEEQGDGRIDEDFLNALEHGMPPTGGLGIGIDRLVMLATNQQSIREVILFPQLKEKG